MAFKMSFSKDDLSGQKPVPPGIYTVQFVDFKPKLSRGGDSVNLNAQVKIVQNPDYDNRRIFFLANTKLPAWIQDMVLSFGLEMEGMGTEEATIPGIFDADKSKYKEEDPSTWKYEGPLTARTAQWDIGSRVDDKGVERNAPRCFIPAIPELAVKWPHVTTCMDMLRTSK